MSNDEQISADEERDQDETRIKVTDRRKFDSAGNLKTEDVDAAPHTEDDGSQDEAEALPDAATGEAPAIDANDEPAAATAPASAPQIVAPTPGISDLPRDFESFVENMYLEAMLYMGAIPDPQTGETLSDLELAKYKIDTLSMIQEKTEGNLSEPEQTQLTEALYQLRMVFVQKSSG